MTPVQIFVSSLLAITLILSVGLYIIVRRTKG
jgi:hypothetical protein